MFSPAARAGTYNALASAHDATSEYSTRFMRIAISISPAVSRRRSTNSWHRLAQSNGCARPSGPLKRAEATQPGDFLVKCIIYPSNRARHPKVLAARAKKPRFDRSSVQPGDRMSQHNNGAAHRVSDSIVDRLISARPL